MVQQAFRVDQVSTSNIEFKSNSFISSIAADATLASNVHLVLPTSVGSSGQVLATDGSGNLSFVSQGVGGPADLVQDNVNSLTSTVDSFGVYANNTFGADGSNVSVANVTSQEFSIDGSTNTFTLVNTTDNVNKLLVSYGGIAQKPSEYTVSNTDLTLSNTRPLVAGTTVEVRYLDFEFSGSVTNSGNAGIVAGGATTVIAPFAFARVASTTNASGTNISWSNWNSSNGTLDFTFSSAQSNTDYIVVSDAETFDDYYVGITNKTVNGFRASFYDGSGNRTPSSSAPFALIIYGATPTVDVNSLSGTSYSTTLYSNISSGVNTFNSASTPSLATYTAGKIGVYRNGVKLPATDYTATDGTSLVLNNATIEGDDIEVVNFGTVSVSLDDVTDVDLTTNVPTNGQALIYVSANSKWEPGSVASSYGNSDVDTHLNQSTASTDQVLSWDGSDYAWVDQSAGGSSGSSTPALTDYEFTATANQTSFAATYIPGSVQVFLNGVKLANTEFTATSGTSIVLGSNTASGDTISVSKIGGSSNLTVANASASSTGSISYDSGSEVLTYTPPDLSGYQSTLVSNTNIKTINGNSVLGSGNITISSGGGVAGTLGSLTKSFANNESATITLSSNVSPVPNVSVFKEIPQQGFSSKGQWDVNANATNYDFFDEKPISYASSTLTPSATGDGTFTNSNPTVVGYQMSSTVNLNSTSPSITSQGSGGSWQVVEFDPTGNHVYMVSSTNEIGYAKTVYQYSMSTPHDLSTLNTTPANTLDMSSRVAGSANIYCPLHITNSGYDLYFGDYQNNIIYQWKMSTAYDLSTASYHGASSAIFVNSMPSLFIQPNGLTGYQVQDGISGSAVLREFTMSTAWDITTASLSGTTSSTLISRTQAVTISPDGTLVIASDPFGSTTSKYFTMSPGYDLSSLSSGTSFTWQGNSSHTADTRFSSDGALLYGWTGTYIYNYTTGTTAAFNAADVGKKVVGNSGSAIITSTTGAYTSVTPFADTSAISSWQLFGAEGKADGSGVLLSGYVSSFNISSSTLSYTWNTSGFSNTLNNMSFKPDGTRVIIVDTGLNNIVSYNLSTPWDLSTATAHYTKTGIQTNNRGIYFKSDGISVWINNASEILSYTLSTAWDISSTWTNTFQTMNSTTLQNHTGHLKDIHFSSDGTKFYLCDFVNRRVTEWDCSTAFRADTATYNNVSLDVNYNSSNIPMGMEFSSNGTVLLVISEQRNLLKYNLSTAWDLSTATYDSLKAVGSSGNCYGLGIDTAGENFYVTIPNVSGDPVLQYYAAASNSIPYSQYMPALTNSSNGQINSSAWQDINSMTADETKNDGDVFYAVSTDNRTSWGVAKASDGVRKIARNNSGTWQYNNDAGSSSSTYYNADGATYNSAQNISNQVCRGAMYFNSSGTKSIKLVQISGYPKIRSYTYTTPYDLTTESYSNETFDPAGSSHSGLYLKPDGTKFYVTDYGADQVIQYDMSTSFDPSSATAGGNGTFALTSTGAVQNNIDRAYGIEFKPDGTRMYVADWNQNGASYMKYVQYNLSTPWDVTTASHAGQWVMSGAGVRDLAFWPDGTKVLAAYDNGTGSNVRAQQYTLSVAWDITSTMTDTGHYLDIGTNASISGFWGGKYAKDGELFIVGSGDGIYVFNMGVGGTTASYGTSETWVNGTNNNEHATLQQALTSQSFNRMNKAQLDAVADAYHFSQDSADTLDLMIAPYATSGASPVSDGVTINYDAEAIVKQAINGTDYEAYFPSSNSVSITSLAAQNLKVRII